MNQFKSLDKHFPTLPNRHSGEVVSLSVYIDFQPSDKLNPWSDALSSEMVEALRFWDQQSSGVLSWKRKAWYVNASSNAFILHRSLCRELAEFLDHEQGLLVNPLVSKQQVKTAKKLLARAVWNSYVLNCTYDDQYHEWLIKFPSPTDCLSTNPSLWWNSNTDDDKMSIQCWIESCKKWKFPGDEDSSLPQVALLQERIHKVNK
jgi:hypothetical protein